MRDQIKQAVENVDSLSQEKCIRMKEILSRYVHGEIELDETYYELIDNDLIDMPKRCSMFVKFKSNSEDDKDLKEYVNDKLFG